MTRLFLTVSLSLICVLPVKATDPIYINNSPLSAGDLPPQIDATAFVNRSIFDVTLPFSGFIFIVGDQAISLGTILNPYQTMNTAFFTNTAGATMLGTPGFRFNFFTNN